MESPKLTSNRYAVLFVICLATTLVPFMSSAVNLALPLIAKEFSLNVIAQSWVVTIFLLVSAILPVPFSKLADRVGRKKIFLIGVAIFTMATLVCASSSSGEMLISGRFLQGFGASMMFATNMAIVTSVFPPSERGKALGIITAVVYVSISSGPFLGGMLTHYYGWRSIYYSSLVICALVLVGIPALMKGEWKEQQNGKFDLVGSILYGVGLSSIIYGFSILPQWLGFLCITAGAISFAIFILYEKKLEFPVLNVRLFTENKVFGFASSAALINYSSTFAISFLLSLYLQYVKGFSAQQAGLVLIAQPIAMTVLSPISGRLSDKIDARNLATLGMSIIVIGLLLMFFLTPATPIWFIIAISVVLGIGFGIFSSPNMNVIMGSVEKKYIGMASATTNTMRLTGQAFSMGITTMVISLCVGKARITTDVLPQFMKSIHITFIILAVLCCIGVYTSWTGKQQKR